MIQNAPAHLITLSKTRFQIFIICFLNRRRLSSTFSAYVANFERAQNPSICIYVYIYIYICFRDRSIDAFVRGMLQRRPIRRMLHDVIILVPRFQFSCIKNIQHLVFSILFPPEGNFDIDAGDGVGGWGPFKTPKSLKTISHELFSHSRNIFPNNLKNIF